MMFSSTTFKNFPKYLLLNLDSNLNRSASASAPLRPNQTLPRLTHPIQSFRYYHTATYRLSQTRVQESPCAPSDEAEDFKRSSRSETSSLKEKGFSREMLGSHVENVGIKASQARASYSRSGERGGAKDLNSLVGTRVGLWPRLLSTAVLRTGWFPPPSKYTLSAGHACKGFRRHIKKSGK